MLLRTNVFRIAVTLVILAGTAAAAAATPGPGLDSELKLLFRSQAADGSLAFDGLGQFYASHPMMATLCLDEHRRRPNAALVSPDGIGDNALLRLPLRQPRPRPRPPGGDDGSQRLRRHH